MTGTHPPSLVVSFYDVAERPGPEQYHSGYFILAQFTLDGPDLHTDIEARIRAYAERRGWPLVDMGGRTEAERRDFGPMSVFNITMRYAYVDARWFDVPQVKRG